MGRTLLTTIGSLVSWAEEHLGDISVARVAYDRRLAESTFFDGESECVEQPYAGALEMSAERRDRVRD
jgi:hypothetical protein